MRWAAAESGSVLALILLYIWWIRPHFPLFWILLLAFVLLSHAVRKETPASLGFHKADFKASAVAYGPYALLLALVLVGAGALFDTIREISIQWACANFGLYCLWGLFQQYLLNGYFINRFVRFTERAPFLAAIIFSAVHTPNWFLMLVTFIGGYCASIAYLRFRNLYFLGLAHGVLGFLIYLVVPDSISRHLWVGPKWFRV
jgi:hypothetical protein